MSTTVDYSNEMDVSFVKPGNHGLTIGSAGKLFEHFVHDIVQDIAH